MYEQGTLKIADRREQLRIKINSLAEEARMIRRAEKKTHGPLRDELHGHRVLPVRSESRAATLAMGLIKGRTWEQMEGKSYDLPHVHRVKALIEKYGPTNREARDVILSGPLFQSNASSQLSKRISLQATPA